VKIVKVVLVVYASVIIYGCSTAKLVRIQPVTEPVPPQITHSIIDLLSNTDPRFVDKVLDKVELPMSLYGRLSYSDRIAVMSVDRSRHNERDAQLVVERALMKKLVTRDYFVLERDENLLGRLMTESTGDAGRLWDYYVSGKGDTLSGLKLPNAMAFATKILTYRILELGITRTPLSNDEKISRIGSVQLELGLVDVSTSKVLFLDIVQGYAQDTLQTFDYNLISNLHYMFPSDALPLVLNLPAKPQIVGLKADSSSGPMNGIDFEFKTGQQATNAYVTVEPIKGKNSNHPEDYKIVAAFKIPGQTSTNFKYHWDLRDLDGKPVEQGRYALWLGSYIVKRFDVVVKQ